MTRLQHDVAWATAKAVMKLLTLGDEELREVFINVYERIKAGLETLRASGQPNPNAAAAAFTLRAPCTSAASS